MKPSHFNNSIILLAFNKIKKNDSVIFLLCIGCKIFKCNSNLVTL